MGLRHTSLLASLPAHANRRACSGPQVVIVEDLLGWNCEQAAETHRLAAIQVLVVRAWASVLGGRLVLGCGAAVTCNSVSCPSCPSPMLLLESRSARQKTQARGLGMTAPIWLFTTRAWRTAFALPMTSSHLDSLPSFPHMYIVHCMCWTQGRMERHTGHGMRHGRMWAEQLNVAHPCYCSCAASQLGYRCLMKSVMAAGALHNECRHRRR